MSEYVYVELYDSRHGFAEEFRELTPDTPYRPVPDTYNFDKKWGHAKKAEGVVQDAPKGVAIEALIGKWTRCRIVSPPTEYRMELRIKTFTQTEAQILLLMHEVLGRRAYEGRSPIFTFSIVRDEKNGM